MISYTQQTRGKGADPGGGGGGGRGHVTSPLTVLPLIHRNGVFGILLEKKFPQ